MSNQHRKPAGTSQGGQFAGRVRDEPPGELRDVEAELNAAARVDVRQLDHYINHPSRDVRCEAAMNAAITDDQIERLANDSDWLVRREVAILPYPGCADRMSNDPEVPVRVAAYTNPYLSPDTKRKLDNDEAVQRVLAAIGGESQ